LFEIGRQRAFNSIHSSQTCKFKFLCLIYHLFSLLIVDKLTNDLFIHFHFHSIQHNREIVKKVLNNVKFQKIQHSLSKWKIQTKMKFQTQSQHWHISTLSKWLEIDKKWRWTQCHHYTIKFKHTSLKVCNWHQLWMTTRIQSTH
jgi:hypothetical protein